MAGWRSQTLLARVLGLALGGLLSGVSPSACESAQPANVSRPLLREAGASEAGSLPDSSRNDTEADAAAGAPDGADFDAGSFALKLGVTPVWPQGASPSDRALAELGVLAAGARARALVARFDALVDATGSPSASAFAELAASAALYRARRGSVLFTIALVDRCEDARPAGLRASWGSAELRASLDALVDRAYRTFGEELSYLSFGSEVDRFLARASDEDRAALTALIEHEVRYARAHAARSPGTRIGVTLSAPGLLGVRLAETAQLLAESEVAIVTGDPLGATDELSPPIRAAAQLADLADSVARGPSPLPVVVQEVGYPSSTDLRSSAVEQAKFYHALFGMLAARRVQFPFVNLYASNDPAYTECRAQANRFGVPAEPERIAARCSLGLKTEAGAEKPAWSAVLSGLEAFAGP